VAGLGIDPHPPVALSDMLGAIVASALAAGAIETDLALLLDSELRVEDAQCTFGVLFVPTADGVERLLGKLGLPRTRRPPRPAYFDSHISGISSK
jgi:chemotaxis protein CheC